MNGPAALIVLVGAGESADPTTLAMDRATRVALDDVALEIHESHTPTPSDEEALAVEKATHSVAIVELRWTDGSHRKATLRIHLANEARWVERAIAFKPSDAFAERGRTLGFAVASMLPDWGTRTGTAATAATATAGGTTAPAAAATSTPSPAPAPAPTSAPAPAPAPAPATATATAPATSTATPTPTPTTTATATATPAAPSTSTSTEAPNLYSLDLLALATLGVESHPKTYGGAVAFNWAPLPPIPSLAARVGASLRAGSLAAVGNTLTFAPTAGIVWRFLQPREGRRVGASARLEFLVVDQAVTHFSSSASTASTTKGRWMSGMGGTLDLEVRASPGADLVLGIGFEEVFSPTYVYVQGANAGSLPATRGISEAGVRLGF
jgi:hypothetical protein